MPSTSELFDLLDFHDAPVVAIEREGDAVLIRLQRANVPTEHPADASARPVCVGPCVLILHRAGSEIARLFDDDTRTWVAHPAPASPFDDDVIFAREEPAGAATRYCFAGMHSAGWSEWEVIADGFTLRWERVLGDAWFADWPGSSGGNAR